MIRSKNITKTWKLDKVAEVETRAYRKHQRQPVDTYKLAGRSLDPKTEVVGRSVGL